MCERGYGERKVSVGAEAGEARTADRKIFMVWEQAASRGAEPVPRLTLDDGLLIS